VVQELEADTEWPWRQKFHDELFKPKPDPSPQTLAQAALYLCGREAAETSGKREARPTPWTTLAGLRFGGDRHVRTVDLLETGLEGGGSTEPARTARVTIETHPLSAGGGRAIDVIVQDLAGESHTFSEVQTDLQAINGDAVSAATVLGTRLADGRVVSTVVRQLSPASAAISASPVVESERLHIFSRDSSTGANNPSAVGVPLPGWLAQARGLDRPDAAHHASCRAPMPSRVVEILVKPGDEVEKGDKVVVCEAMKTEVSWRPSPLFFTWIARLLRAGY
jgi:3-methylcrotonyl-CoA carboxylase alpha subunit